MLRIALTGGIGSGKSTAAAHFRLLGATVSSSDEVARKLMQPGEALFQPILDHFGPTVLAADGTLDRKALARIVFDPARIDEINRIVHPVVIEAQSQWLQSFENHKDAVAIVETALLFESKYRPFSNQAAPWRDLFDRTILITAPEALRLERYRGRCLPRDANTDLNLLNTTDPVRSIRHPVQSTDHPERNADHPERNSDHPERNSDHPERNSDHPERNSRHPEQSSRHPERSEGPQSTSPAFGLSTISPIEQHDADPAVLEADFHRRAALQTSDEHKAAHADFILHNDGTLAELQAAVAVVFRQLRSEAAANRRK